MSQLLFRRVFFYGQKNKIKIKAKTFKIYIFFNLGQSGGHKAKNDEKLPKMTKKA